MSTWVEVPIIGHPDWHLTLAWCGDLNAEQRENLQDDVDWFNRCHPDGFTGDTIRLDYAFGPRNDTKVILVSLPHAVHVQRHDDLSDWDASTWDWRPHITVDWRLYSLAEFPTLKFGPAVVKTSGS